ncbi:MAG: hypothetical protein IT305_19455 [Chloroflexi bacterium]|nr:hypothetical protein [Chloroflexota bacterium]
MGEFRLPGASHEAIAKLKSARIVTVGNLINASAEVMQRYVADIPVPAEDVRVWIHEARSFSARNPDHASFRLVDDSSGTDKAPTATNELPGSGGNAGSGGGSTSPHG